MAEVLVQVLLRVTLDTSFPLAIFIFKSPTNPMDIGALTHTTCRIGLNHHGVCTVSALDDL